MEIFVLRASFSIPRHIMCVDCINISEDTFQHLSVDCIVRIVRQSSESDYDFSEVSFFVSLCFCIFLYFCAMHCSLAVWQPCDKRQWLRCGLRQWLQWLQCGPPRQIETCASEWPMAFGHCCCWGETVCYSTTSPCFLLLALLLLPIFFSNCPPPAALSGVALNVLQHSF